MNNFEKLRAMSVEQLIEWLLENGHDDAAWWKWFESTYCDKCGTITVEIDAGCGKKRKCESQYCEEYDKCRFFPDMKLFDKVKTVKMWLEAEVNE